MSRTTSRQKAELALEPKKKYGAQRGGHEAVGVNGAGGNKKNGPLGVTPGGENPKEVVEGLVVATSAATHPNAMNTVHKSPLIGAVVVGLGFLVWETQKNFCRRGRRRHRMPIGSDREGSGAL